jgi:hypothetical protein
MRRLALLALVALVAACNPPVPSPLVGQTRFLCCNLHYDRTKISDVNWQVGALVPLGTPVTIIGVRKKSVTFQPVGSPEITLEHKYGRRTESMQQFLDHWFVEDDPSKGLRRLPAKLRKSIEQGVVEPGMTRAQVLMAIGYPPAHETPSLESPQWNYWRNRWERFFVFFDGDKVARVQS